MHNNNCKLREVNITNKMLNGDHRLPELIEINQDWFILTSIDRSTTTIIRIIV